MKRRGGGVMERWSLLEQQSNLSTLWSTVKPCYLFQKNKRIHSLHHNNNTSSSYPEEKKRIVQGTHSKGLEFAFTCCRPANDRTSEHQNKHMKRYEKFESHLSIFEAWCVTELKPFIIRRNQTTTYTYIHTYIHTYIYIYIYQISLAPALQQFKSWTFSWRPIREKKKEEKDGNCCRLR